MSHAAPVFPDTRWSLIGRIADQPDSAGLLIDLYADAIARYLRQRLPTSAAQGDDVVQDVLLHLLERPELIARARPDPTAGPGQRRFRYYIMTLALNEARNALRRTGRWRDGACAMLDGDHAAEADGDAQAQAMDRAWAESVIAGAWRDLSGWADQGALEAPIPAMLEAHLVQGRTVRQVAEEQGLSIGACHRWLARGRTLLQQAILERMGGEAAGDADAAWEVLVAALGT
jgi:RNA polymerase sigma factor (sigma-70 family)